MHPIGVNPEGLLVWGERRLAAARQLGWEEITACVYDGDALGAEFAENEMRKNFTSEEKVKILQSIERKERGGIQSPDRANEATASKVAGFPSRQTANRAVRVVEKGVPELVAAMNREEIAIEAAAILSRRPAEEQRAIVALPAPQRDGRIKELRHAAVKQRGERSRLRSIRIKWSARQAATALTRAWPSRRMVNDRGGAASAASGSRCRC